jgi:pyruvate dehydrogenase E1 component alpha subunit
VKEAVSLGLGPAEAPAGPRHEMLSKLVLVREFELACERWWKAGVPLVGEFHLSLGQEAFAVGTCMAARPTDPICPSIRGMGVYLCRGVPMVRLIASFLEKQGAISEGRWAHWHTGVEECHILPQTGMLGAGLATAVGVAMAKKLQGSNDVVVGMLGDGSTNTGYFHEAANLAAVKKLPIVIVIENNQYAISTPIRSMALVDNLSERAAAYGMPGVTADASDVVEVHDVMRTALERARRREGPTLVELKAYRWGGQTIKDADRVRPAEEKAAARSGCPIDRLRRDLTATGALGDAGFTAMVAETRAAIDEAYEQARSLPPLAAPPDAAVVRTFDPYAASGH